MKTRSVLILVGTLIIGVALGMLISVQIQNAQMKKFRSFGSREGFKEATFQIIQPTPEQQSKIEAIIDDFACKNDSLRKEYRTDFISLMKRYHEELYPLLTQKQIERLEKMTQPHKHFRKGKGEKKPGEGGPPPPDKSHRGRFFRVP
jgi:hypothetical protein